MVTETALAGKHNLRALLKKHIEIGQIILALVEREPVTVEAEPSLYYSDEENPIGSRTRFRAFLKREGVPSRLAGQRRLALRSDVDAALASGMRRPRALASAEPSDRELLARVGSRTRGEG